MSELIIDKITTRDGSSIGAIVVADIDELLLLNTNKEINTTAIVKDSNRGGVFNYDGAQSGVNNGGTIFNGWVRQYDGAVNVKWFGAIGDGITDNTAIFNKLKDYNMTLMLDGNFVVNDLTLSKNLTLKLLDGSSIISTSGILNIYSKVISVDYPIAQKGGTIYMQSFPISVGVGKDFLTIQEAVDSVPSIQWQRFNIILDDDIYDEEVLINNKRGGSSVKTGGERAGLQVSGTTRTGTIVKAFLVVSSGGSAWNPSIVNLTVNGYNTITNELSSIEYYGCDSGAISNVSFTSNTADRCVTSYASKITVEGLDFGDSLYNYGLITKHGGEIYSPNNEALGVGTDHIGTLNIAVTRVISGYINACTLASVKTNGYTKHDTTGLRSGFIYESQEKLMYGPQIFNKSISNYQTFFENLDNFESYVASGASAVVTSSQGITLVAPTSKVSTIWTRRYNALRNASNSNIFSSQMLISLTLTSITGDGAVKFGNAGSVSEGGYGFQITVANGIRGYYNNAGTEVFTDTIFDYSALVATNINCFVSTDRDNNLEFSVNRNNLYTASSQFIDGTLVTVTNSSFVISCVCVGNGGTAEAVFNEARAARF
jgi:hypothetical protein